MKKVIILLILSLLTAFSLAACSNLQTCNVSFELNGGYGECNDITVFYGKRYGKLPTPQREGYQFEGWMVEIEDGGKMEVDRFSIVENENDHVLIAQWSLLMLDVTFDMQNGTEPDNYSVPYGFNISMPTEYPSNHGYIFEGWFMLIDSVETPILYDSFNVLGDLYVYAKWQIIMPQITEFVGAESINENEYFLFCQPQITAVDIANRLSISDGSNLIISLDQEGKSLLSDYNNVAIEDGNNIFYIIVTAVDPDYSVHYTLNIHKSYQTQVIFHIYDPLDAEEYYLFYEHPIDVFTGDEFSVETSRVSPAGYEFGGWLIKNDKGEFIEFISTDRLLGSIDLYAVLTPIDYDIIYVLDDGFNHVENPEIYTVRDIIILNQPIKPGYNFVGWFKEPEHINAITQINHQTETITIYAQWEIRQYSIEYTSEIQGITNPNTLTEYDILTPTYPLEDAHLDGYEFLGWYDVVTQLRVYEVCGGAYGDLILQARWQVDE